MSRVLTSGFELNSTTTGMEFTSTSGTPTISSATVRSGTYSGRISSLGSGTAKYFTFQYSGSVSSGPRFTRFFVRFTTLPSAENRFFLLNDAANTTTPLIYLTVDNSGTLKLYDEDGQITGTTTFSTGVWYRVEVKYDATAAAGSHIVEGKVNGTVFATASNRSLSSGMHTFLLGGNLAAEAQTTGDWFFDDVAHNSSSGSAQTGYPGDGSVVFLRPNAAGDNAEWDLGTGTSYTEVDEVTPDDVTTYIATDDTTNDIFDANIENAPSAIGTNDAITLVSVGMRGTVSATTTTEPQVVLRVKASAAGTVEESSAITLANALTYATNNTGTSPSNYLLTLYDKPSTAVTTPWTKSDLDSAQIGIRLSTADAEADDVRISALWMLVEYQTLPTTVLNSPADASSDTDTTPTLNFTGTDSGGETLEYNVQINTSNTLDTTIRASSQNSSTTGTAISVTAPTGTTTGDVVVVTVHGNGQTTIVDNNGATPFTEDLNDSQPNTTSGQTVSVFSRRIVGGDPGTYNFTLGASGRWSIIAVTFQNPHASDIYDVTPATSNLDSPPGASTASAPSITTITKNAIHCACAFIDASVDDFTAWPAGYTVHQSVDNNQGQTFTTKVISAAGATGAQPFVHNGSGTAYIGVSFAIKNIAVSLDKVSETDTGFTAGHPFGSGVAKDFTVQAGDALSTTTYYWRARAIDPIGSNTYGPWPSTRSFTITGGGGTVVKDMMGGMIPFAR